MRFFYAMKLLLAITILFSCTPILQQYFLTTSDIHQLPDEYAQEGKRQRDACSNALLYAPDTNHLQHTPMRYIRVNVHYMNSSDSSRNYNGEEAIKFAKGLIGNANYDLEHNAAMFLPYGQNAPPLPIQFRLALTPVVGDKHDEGIYFHYDDELCYYIHRGKNSNIYDRRMYDKYGVQKDSVINIFIMPHHPDSVASKTYSSSGVGVAVGNFLKMAGMYEDGGPYWNYRQIINHEIGHIFGLAHTWAFDDGCDDTPKHPNYWHPSVSNNDSLQSNNIMDYNAWQQAWTPCQIGKVHYRMADINSKQRPYLIKKWCQWKAEAQISISDSIHWQSAKDLEGDITIESGGVLRISCRVSLPQGAKITVAPGGKLILDNCRLHNDCGDEWEGIELQQLKDKKGEVVFIGKPRLENMVHPVETLP